MQVAQARSLRVLKLTLVGCLLFPLALLAYAALWLDRDLRHQAEQTNSATLDVAAEHALKVFQVAELSMDAMRLLTADLDVAELRAHEPQLHTAFHGLRRDVTALQAFWLIGPDGTVLATDYSSPPPVVDLTGRPYFHALAAGDAGCPYRKSYAG